MKKKKGEVHLFIMQFIGIFICFAILLYSTYFFSITIAYNNINQCARKYILKMERQGYLTYEDVSGITETLDKNNYIQNVRVEVSNLEEANKAKYGDEIKIAIRSDIKEKKLNFSGFFMTTDDEYESVVVEKASTARW